MPKGKPSKNRKSEFITSPPEDTVESFERMKEIRCVRCGSKATQNFYKTKDPARSHFGRVCYCKNCVKDIYNGYLEKNNGNILFALYYMCRKIDVPYVHLAAQSAIENINNPSAKIQGEDAMVSAYMKNLAFSETNGWGCTFDDSQGISQIPGMAVYEEEIKVKKKKVDKPKKNDDKYEYIEYDLEELVQKWGDFEPDDLAYLESEYLDWEDKLNGITEKSTDMMVKQVCLQDLDIRKDRENWESVDKKIKTLQDLLKNSGLLEKQKKISEQRNVGMSIDEIEFHRPIIKPDPDFEDVDNFNMIWTGYSGSMSRVMGKTNRYTELLEKNYGPYSVDIIDELLRQQDEVVKHTENTEEKEEVELIQTSLDEEGEASNG